MPAIDLSPFDAITRTVAQSASFNSMLALLQSTINGLDQSNFAAGKIFDPAKLMQNAAIDGDPLCWDNSLAKWVPASTLVAGRPRAARMVVSTMAGGPPSSPVDQDIWVATAVDANGTRWAFQYNAGSVSASKWEFIGGFPLALYGAPNAIVNSATQVGATGYYYAAGMSYSTPRAGDWSIDGNVLINQNGGAAGYSSIETFAGTAVLSPLGLNVPTSTAVAYVGAHADAVVPSLAAATTIGIAAQATTPGTYRIDTFSLKILPRRIT